MWGIVDRIVGWVMYWIGRREAERAEEERITEQQIQAYEAKR